MRIAAQLFAKLTFGRIEIVISPVNNAQPCVNARVSRICNACSVPYVVVHDRDAPRGAQPSEAEQIANEAILRIAGKRRTTQLVPDFEGVTGQKARRGKPAAAYKRFSGPDAEVPGPLRQAVERIVSASRHAPRTTRGA